MDKELIDQLWNRATRETLNSGALNERYRFAQLVFELGVKHGPDYKHGYADGAFAEREACAKLCDGIKYEGCVAPEDGAAADYYDDAARECADAIRARGND